MVTKKTKDSVPKGVKEKGDALLDSAEIISSPPESAVSVQTIPTRPPIDTDLLVRCKKGLPIYGGTNLKPWFEQVSLPPDCPVKVLGYYEKFKYYATPMGTLMSLKDNEHDESRIIALFGGGNYLFQTFPKLRPITARKDDDTLGIMRGDVLHYKVVENEYEWKQVRWGLLSTASNKGIWTPEDFLKKGGSHLTEDGTFYIHCGNAVFTMNDGRLEKFSPGVKDKLFFELSRGTVHPLENNVSVDSIKPLYQALQSWNWRLGGLGAYLMMGWIASGMIGGALNWRPLVWITSESGAGKSTLHELVADILGGGAVKCADATPAGIRRNLKGTTYPIIFDELETENADDKNAQNIVRLARHSASGGEYLRGGDAEMLQTIKSGFMFSSVFMPSLAPQDRNRIAILEIDSKVDEHTGIRQTYSGGRGMNPNDLSPTQRLEISQAILTRVVHGMKHLQGHIDAWTQQLKMLKCDARGIDRMGGLLACADLILRDKPRTCPEDYHKVLEDVAKYVQSEKEDNIHDSDKFVEYLKSVTVDSFKRGVKASLGELIRDALRSPDLSKSKENVYLERYGIRVIEQDAQTVTSPDIKDATELRDNFRRVAFMKNNSQLSRLLKETRWFGDAYYQALGRIPVQKRQKVYFNGTQCRVISLPWQSFFDKRPIVEYTQVEVEDNPPKWAEKMVDNTDPPF